MKNIGIAIVAALMIASCVKKEGTPAEVNTTIESTSVKKTVVVDTVQAAKPKDDGTSVKINSKGVDVDSKDVQVEIKK